MDLLQKSAVDFVIDRSFIRVYNQFCHMQIFNINPYFISLYTCRSFLTTYNYASLSIIMEKAKTKVKIDWQAFWEIQRDPENQLS